jgi:hypothetical protein
MLRVILSTTYKSQRIVRESSNIFAGPTTICASGFGDSGVVEPGNIKFEN